MESEALVRATPLFSSLYAEHPRVEVWADDGVGEGEWSYFWIVSKQDGSVRNLAYVRVKDGVTQRRTYDEKGDDLWADAGAG